VLYATGYRVKQSECERTRCIKYIVPRLRIQLRIQPEVDTASYFEAGFRGSLRRKRHGLVEIVARSFYMTRQIQVRDLTLRVVRREGEIFPTRFDDDYAFSSSVTMELYNKS
jgi:hypothetical protein